MAHDLNALLGPDGVIRRADLAGRVDRHTLTRWLAQERLVQPHPGVLALPERFEEWRTRAIAGVLATRGVLSHRTALAAWRLAPKEGVVHASVPVGRHAPRSAGLVVHRVQRLDADRVGGLPVTELPRSLVDTWALAFGPRGGTRSVELARGAVITALRNLQVRPDQLRAQMAARPALSCARELAGLISLVEQGCHSELEIWGLLKVLKGPGMPRFVQQHPVVLAFGVVHLDVAIPELKVAVELDGAAFHGSQEARERDIRRDAALAARGWVVLRFSYRRLVTEPAACRREILQVCAAR